MAETGEEEIDRLSHLPDHILLHILSFLGTKFSVQTSALSTSWRSAWKHVPRLNFDSDSFPRSRGCVRFIRFLDHVLDGRSDVSHILKISYKFEESGDMVPHGYEKSKTWRRQHKDALERVLRYADSHHTRQIRIETGFDYLSFSNSVGSFASCDLELARANFRTAVEWNGFGRLASLNLEECNLCGGDKELEFDFFAKFPCLKNLVLLDCNFIGEGFKITGPQLVNLETHAVKNLGGATVEIVAPKLKSLSLVFYMVVPKFSRFSLPLLDHATLGIKFGPYFLQERKTILTANFVNLFQALHNAASLRFNHHIIEAMSTICDGLEHYRCPLIRLHCLKVPRSRVPETIPDKLIAYFLKGSNSSTNPGFLQFV